MFLIDFLHIKLYFCNSECSFPTFTASNEQALDLAVS